MSEKIDAVRSGRRRAGSAVLPLCLALASLAVSPAAAQQFNSDNQWVAPNGVATFVRCVGQEYSTAMAVAALLPETEFNLGLTRFENDPQGGTDAHYSGTFYVQRRLVENDAGTGGWAIMGGTGVDPSHLEQGEVTDTFRSWWANAVYTVPFRDGQVTWDLLPGFLVNLDKDRAGEEVCCPTSAPTAAGSSKGGGSAS